MKNKNELCQFSAISDGIIIPAVVTARIVGCSESTVKKVRTGVIGKSGRGKTCQQVVLVDQLLIQAVDMGVKEVQKVVESTK
ncbi:hypothetical protein [Sphingobacterium sp. FBM7-1]|uniref:hypothetical protein n=1 Tax=Sphingobacterium sp. FBM7-1 TaxID=2886688 RepID=UPI001D10AE37|nr:hypothetical protein [Sphingobacterium sp. FBM7-1]MCC2598023.1 hypothetical protein [Sphingobacterium sp. FBM7-1]